jgi:MFS family permease
MYAMLCHIMICSAITVCHNIFFPSVEASLATSLVIVGAWIGSLLGSGPSQLYGKRIVLLANNAFFIAGAAMSASGNIYALFIGRFISGLGAGVASGVPSVLLSEIASADTRGTITTLHQVTLLV